MYGNVRLIEALKMIEFRFIVGKVLKWDFKHNFVPICVWEALYF